MNAAPATADLARDPVQRDPDRGPLLGLVRKLIYVGRDLLATLQGPNAAAPPLHITRRFGGVALALIIARITRGLMIAAALERRLLHPRPRSAGQTKPTKPRAQPASRHPRLNEDEELLGNLPSAREIAARIRSRKTGAVIADICRDLGIATDHPLWREIHKAILSHGGSMVKVMNVWFRRARQAAHLPVPPEDAAAYDRLLAAYARPP